MREVYWLKGVRILRVWESGLENYTVSSPSKKEKKSSSIRISWEYCRESTPSAESEASWKPTANKQAVFV